LLAVTLKGLRPLLATRQRILEAAPQPQVGKVVHRLAPDLQYVRTDLMDLRFADVCADALALPFCDGVFDVALHFHVFEHIADDRTAMSEVARVLRPGGLLICQVPRRAGTATDEAFGLSHEENKARFGQADHVRYYGDDFEDRLIESGFGVVSYTATDIVGSSDLKRFNIPRTERLWFCTTPASGGRPDAAVAGLDRKLAAANRRYEQLRSRKVVRASLVFAEMARPAITALRRMSGSR
jgi:SAM-dependent methyltransferase